MKAIIEVSRTSSIFGATAEQIAHARQGRPPILASSIPRQIGVMGLCCNSSTSR